MCEDIRWDRCARPSAVRVTGGARSFSVHHFFPIVGLLEMEAAPGVSSGEAMHVMKLDTPAAIIAG